jgi:hypothetical protein
MFDILVSGTRESALTADEARRGLTGRLFRIHFALEASNPVSQRDSICQPFSE